MGRTTGDRVRVIGGQYERRRGIIIDFHIAESRYMATVVFGDETSGSVRIDWLTPITAAEWEEPES